MKYLIPVLVGGATATVAITTAIAQAHGAFTGNASLKPYLYGYGAATLLLLIAVITAIKAGRQESKPNATAKLQEAKHRETKLRLASLMEQEAELRQRLISAPSNADFSKTSKECEQWVTETVALLNEADLPTDAVAFSQIRNLAPVAKYVDEFRHVQDWKRGELAKLAMYREKLDQIRDVRRM
jgi:hypothetical protein